MWQRQRIMSSGKSFVLCVMMAILAARLLPAEIMKRYRPSEAFNRLAFMAIYCAHYSGGE